jgi:putative tryptophan/tyrosine transport system substrate-binding protein
VLFLNAHEIGNLFLTNSLGLQLQSLEVRRPDEFAQAFAAMTREHADALVVISNELFFGHRSQLAELTGRHRLPAMFHLREYAEAGGLMAYGPDAADMYRRAATYVDKILKGAMPADLPVEQPVKFDLVINLKTAQALGLTIPPSILFQADEVIKSIREGDGMRESSVRQGATMGRREREGVSPYGP